VIVRVCGAIIRKDEILMVHHIHDGRDYWTLPGGGVEEGEIPEDAIVREIQEEVCLDVVIKEVLFDEESKGNICRCYLLEEKGTKQLESLGYDPEDAHLPKEEKMLQGIQWFTLEEKREDPQVKKVIEVLKLT